MPEERQPIMERVVKFVMELKGAEEVEKKVEKADSTFNKFAKNIQTTKREMVELSSSFKALGTNISASMLKQLPQTTEFLKRYGMAMKPLAGTTQELSAAQWVLTDSGREAAISTGLMAEAMDDGKSRTEGLKDAFQKLSGMARGLLRIFVAFRILKGVARFFSDIAEASLGLQMEMWRLRATTIAVGDSLEGGAPAWEEWVEMVRRLRRDLPYVSTKEIAEGLRQITAIVGPLGLTADQLEILTRLIGQMSLLVGQEFLPYMNQIITATTGTGRAVASLGIDLRDGSVGLNNYAEAAGFVWEELNAQQRMYVRLAYATSVMAERSEILAEAEEEVWVQQKEVVAAREDLMAQSPELGRTSLLWQTILLQTTGLLITIAEKVNNFIASIIAFGMTVGTLMVQLGAIRGLRAAIWGAEEPGDVERFEETYKLIKDGLLGVGEAAEEAEDKVDKFAPTTRDAARGAEELAASLLEMARGAGDVEDAFEGLGDILRNALSQAQNAVRGWRQALEQAAINLGRRLADIARNLYERLFDLEQRFQARRAQLHERFEERRRKVEEEGRKEEEKLREEHNKDLQRTEEDHQREMRQLRDDYLLDLEDAARRRDAISMRRIQQRYTLEKQQREGDYDINRRRAIEDFEEQLEELKEATQEQLEELRSSLEQQLRELQDNYIQQQQEARRNADRQAEDARRNYREREADLWESLQNRLEAILIGLKEEEEEWEGTYAELKTFLSEWYEGDLGLLQAWLNARLNLLQTHPGSPTATPSGYTVSPYLTAFGLAQGGMGIARGPTALMVGEREPEMFAAWPLGQRMPSRDTNIRLTIDGEQRGAWSGDFENEVLRILRGSLEDIL